ncbi:PGAM-domain-containing protein [Neolentinus lepideus HHB14362 ss-1]|uniref:PGAM-domain-containing protein n=1 Tax=Neolentinus lepideus HHB14362 ss-1 TaxID=1314782 RepID=A0A165VZC3_9AGAM|nr:PGAM-domain-containing protein [Neolentinus lepideus HHB14362 ss-1]
MIETIYIARHGFRLNWVTNNWKSETGLPRDPPLAVYGETQAKELGEYFASLPEHQRPTAIFSSPYYRCLQTAKPVSQALNVPIYVEHGLSEWYSPVEAGTGLHPRPASATELKKHFPEIDDSWSSIWYPSRKGEDVDEVHDRVAGLLKLLVPEVERRFSDRHHRILLVSHAATVIALARELLGNRTLPLRIGCCSLTELDRKSEANVVLGGWEAKRLGSGSHLKEGASRDWGFEDIEIADGKVVEDKGVPGTEDEVDEPVGSQLGESTQTASRM